MIGLWRLVKICEVISGRKEPKDVREDTVRTLLADAQHFMMRWEQIGVAVTAREDERRSL